MIPSRSNPNLKFETTVFTPVGSIDSINPLVIINHGTSPSGEQKRERAIHPTKFFLELGYTVILPMRRGYSGSGGERVKVHDCNLTRYGLQNAEDIEDVINWLKTHDRFRNRKIIMIGQSTGGLTTMAYSSLSAFRVDAIINFHGGMRPSSDSDCKWNARIEAFQSYARTSSPNSLWIYTANDHSSNPEYITKLYKSFTDSGGRAKLIQLPAFKEDGHFLFGDPDGGPIWQSLVLDYLKELKLYPLTK